MKRMKKIFFILPLLLLLIGCSRRNDTKPKDSTTKVVPTTSNNTSNTTKPTPTTANKEVGHITTSKNIEDAGSITEYSNQEFYVGDTITLTETTNTGYKFLGWYIGSELQGEDETLTITMNKADIEVVATYDYETYNVEISNDDTLGTVTGANSYKYKESVTLTATPNDGYTFDGWYSNGEFVDASSTYTFTMPSNNVSYTATYKAIKYTATLTTNDLDAGTLTGSGEYDYKAEVTIEATVNTGYVFLGWFDGTNRLTEETTYTFNMPIGGVNYEAKYGYNDYTVSLSVYENTGGTVAGAGTYSYKESIEIVATPDTGYKFIGWFNGENLVDTNATYGFVMPHNDLTYIAKFEKENYMVSISKNIDEAGTVTGSGEYNYLDIVTVKATPDSGYIFIGWYINDEEVESAYTYSFYMGIESVNLVAKFDYGTFNLIYRDSTNSQVAGTVTGPSTAKYKSEVTCSLERNSKEYAFIGWFMNDEFVSQELSITFEMPKDFVYITTKWVKIDVKVFNGRTITFEDFYNVGDEITVTPTPSYDTYRFIGWYSGDELVSSELAYTFTITETMILPEAYFGQIVIYGTTESVTNPELLTENFKFGDTVKVKVTMCENSVNSGEICTYLFTGWYSNSNLITYDRIYEFTYTKNIAVYFLTATYKVLSIRGITNAFSNVTSIDQNTNIGDTITLSVEMNEGYTFDGWKLNNEIISTDLSYTFVLEDDTYIFYLTATSYTLSISSNNLRVKVFDYFTDEEIDYKHNPITLGRKLRIVPQANTLVIDGYYVDGELVSSDYEYVFTMPASNVGVTINYYSLYVHTKFAGTELTVDGQLLAGNTITVTAKGDLERYYFNGFYSDSSFTNLLETETTYTFTLPTNNTDTVYVYGYFNSLYIQNYNSSATYTTTFTESTKVGDEVSITVTVLDGKSFDYFMNIDTEEKIYTNPLVITLPSEDIQYRIVLATYYLSAEKQLNDTIHALSLDDYNPGTITEYSAVPTPDGTEITLSATVNSGYTFVGWYDFMNNEYVTDELTYSFIMPKRNARYIAKYMAYKLYVSMNESQGTGTIYDDGLFVSAGEEVTLSAQPIGDYSFNGWRNIITNEYESYDLNYTVTMPNGDLRYQAMFTTFRLTTYLMTDETSHGEIEKYNFTTVVVGNTYTLNAYPYLGYEFDGWYIYDSETSEYTKVSSDSSYDITIVWSPNTDYSYYAKFTPKEEMAMFSFGSTPTTCTIYSLTDTTLTEVTIPSYVTQISGASFKNNTTIESVTLPNTLQIPEGLFEGCSSLTNVNIPTCMTTIPNSLFKGCSSLVSITLPENVTIIQSNAFRACSNLEEIINIEQVTAIGTTAFANSGLTTFVMPENVTVISEFLFEGSSLKNIVISANITEIKNYAFRSSNLTNIYYNGTIENWLNIQLANNLMQIASNFYILDGEGTIEFNGDNYSLLEELIIPDGVTSINASQFYGFKMSKLVISDTVTTIEAQAFRDCPNLEVIILGSGLETIEGYAFYGCNNVRRVYICGDNSYFSSINIASSNSSLYGIDKIFYYAETKPSTAGNYWHYNSLGEIEEYDFSHTVTVIINNDAYGAFSGETVYVSGKTIVLRAIPYVGHSLVNWVKPNGTTSTNEVVNYTMGDEDLVFYLNFQSQAILDNYTYEASATELTITGLTDNTIEEIMMPDYVTSINDNAFSGSMLETIIYLGTEDDWNSINKDEDDFNNITVYCYSEEVPTNIGNHWHFKEGNISFYKDEYYTIAYFLNTQDDSIITNDENNITSYNCYTEFTFFPARKVGYEFKGWYLKYVDSFVLPEYTYEFNKLNLGMSGNITLTPKFEAPEELQYYNYTIYTDPITSDTRLILNSVKDEYLDATELVVPKAVDIIAQGAFANCSNLESLTIPFVGYQRVNKSSSSAAYPLGYMFSSTSKTGYTEVSQTYYKNPSSHSTQTATYYIPSTLKNITVTDSDYIQYGAFHNCTMLEHAVIENATILGDRSFWKCGNLLTIDLPDTLITMEYLALNECKKLESLVIPDSVETIGKQAVNNTGISSLVIGSGVKTIDEMAFYYSPNLEEVIVPNNVQTIGAKAFGYCANIKKISLPFVGDKRHSATDNNQYPFGYIFGTTENNVTRAMNQTYISVYDANEPTYATETYYIPAFLEEVTITGCEYIQYGAFGKVYWIPRIVLDCNIKTIAAYAFNECEDLEELVLPEGLKKINKYAFRACESLTEIVIPNSVVYMGEGLFADCYYLQSLSIPFVGEKKYSSTDSNQYPLAYLFNGQNLGDYILTQTYDRFPSVSATNTITIRMNSNLKEIKVTNCSYIQKGALTNLQAVTTIVIGNSVETIAEGALSGCSSLESLTIPFVGDRRHATEDDYYRHTFGYIFGETEYNGSYLAAQQYYADGESYPPTINYYLPETLSEVIITDCDNIPLYAFQRVTYINTVVLLDCVTKIENYAFMKSGVSNVVLPNVNLNIGYYSFYQANSLERIYYNGTIADWFNNITFLAELPDTLDNIYIFDVSGTEEFNGNTYSLIPNDLTLSDGLTKIGSYAFSPFKELTSLTIPSSLKKISIDAFLGLDNLENVYFDGSLEDWCDIKFAYCNSNPMFYASNFFILDENGLIEHNEKHYSIITELIIPSTITKINQYQFLGFKSVESIVIHDNVTYIDSGAFAECDIIESITLPIIGGGKENNDTHSDEFTYIFCRTNISSPSTKPKKVILSEKVTTIPILSFNDVTFIEEVTILGNVKTIEYRAFKGCISLKKINLPDSIEYISGGAFYDCSSLESIIIGNNVKSIGGSAFNGCTHLRTVYNFSNLNIKKGSKSNGYVAFYAIALFTNENDELSYINVDDYVFTYGDGEAYLLEYNGSDSNITLPESFIYNGEPISSYSIYREVFKNNTNLVSIIIPDSVKSIGEDAFANCTNLEYVSLGNNISSISLGAFDNCASLEYNTFDNAYYLGNSANLYLYLIKATSTDITSCEINSNCIFIAAYSFNNCRSLSSISLQNGLIAIGEHAFDGCIQLLEVIIPESVDYINSYAFSNCTHLETVVLPTGLEVIEEYTFYLCNELTTVNIPETVTTIGDFAFYGAKLTELLLPEEIIEIGTYAFYGINITSLELPSSLTSLSESVFENCHELEELYIPNTIIYIGDSCFKNCENLASVEIPSSVKSIGEMAFAFCNSLTSFVIPDTIETVGAGLLYKCNYIESLTLPFIGDKGCIYEINTQYTLKFLFVSATNKDDAIGDKSFAYTGRLKTVILTRNFLLPDYAFARFSGLETIILPEGITIISEYAFHRCNSLKSVYIPGSVTTFEDYSFAGQQIENIYFDGTIEDFVNIDILGFYAHPLCSEENLYLKDENGTIVFNGKKFTEIGEELIIPDSVTEIKMHTFTNFKMLKRLVLPSSITKIGVHAFAYLTNIEEVYYNGTIEDWCSIQMADFYSSPMTCSNVEDRCFYILNENGIITYNGNNYSPLTKVVVPESINKLAYHFTGMKQLEIVIIPDTVTSIGESTFGSCSNISTLVIPKNISLEYIFVGEYPELEYIYFNGSIEDWLNIDFSKSSNPLAASSSNNCKLYILDENGEFTYEGNKYNVVTDVIIPDNITTIQSYALANLKQLVNLTIHSNVIKIDSNAFDKSTNLENVYYNGTIEDWCNIRINSNPMYYASNFYIQDNNGTIIHNGIKYILFPSTLELPSTLSSIGSRQFHGFNQIETVIIPDSVCSIGAYAFSYCINLVNIVIPNSVTSIGDNAFSSSISNLTNVYYNGTMDDWFNVNLGNYYSNPMCSATNFYILNDNGNVTFKGNKYSLVTEITMPNTITEIKYHLYGFNCITKVTISNSVTKIGSYAFKGCTNLVSITISSSVTTINQYAFTECNSLTSIVIPSSVTYIGNYAFSNCTSLTTLTIQDNVSYIDIYAFKGCTNLRSVIIPTNMTYIKKGVFYGCESLEKVYYRGTQTDWENVSFDNDNDYLQEATVYFYSETSPTTPGNYWHYDTNNNPVIW